MSRTGRHSLLVVSIAVLVASFSLSVMAQEGEEGSEDEGGGTTTTSIETGLTPAVPVEGDEVAVEEPADWTYRYMIPTALALAAVVILVTAIKYFTDVVRKRYRILEE